MTDPDLARALAEAGYVDEEGDSILLAEFSEKFSDEFVKNLLKFRPSLLAAALTESPRPTRERAEEVQRRYADMLAADEARRLYNAHQRRGRPPVDVATLAEVLARPEPPRDRIEGLVPWGSSTLITASRKVGKTTLSGNLTNSLLTGDPFLGQFLTVPVTGRVGFLNYEVSSTTLARWLDEMRIDHERVVLVNARGRSNPLADDGERAELAQQLREANVESLIVDPFGRAFTGDNQNDASQVARFTSMLDAFAREQVGATDLFLTNHAGWNGERTRGSSALEDWPDSLWRLVKDEEDEDGVRYFSAFGRDVDVPEDALDYDADTRRLVLSGSGSRKENRSKDRNRELSWAAIDVVRRRPGLNTREIGDRLEDVPKQNGDLSKALLMGVEEGSIYREKGPRNSWIYYPAEASGPGVAPDPVAPSGPGTKPLVGGVAPESARVAPGQLKSVAPTPLYGGGGTTTDSGVVKNG